MKKFLLSAIACSAFVAAQAWEVKFTNPDGWDEPYIWAWIEGGDNFTGGTWPGEAMTLGSDNLWVFEYTGPLTSMPEYVIFNNNNQGGQSPNLTFVDGATYDMKGVVGAEMVTHTAYVKNVSGWDQVAVYTYNNQLMGAFPGTVLEKGDDGLYIWTFKTDSETVPTFDGIIFNNTDGEQSKCVITYFEEGAVYCTDGTVENIEIPLPDKLYLRGDFNEWGASDDYVLNGEDGIYTGTFGFNNFEAGNFLFKLTSTTEWNGLIIGSTINDRPDDEWEVEYDRFPLYKNMAYSCYIVTDGGTSFNWGNYTPGSTLTIKVDLNAGIISISSPEAGYPESLHLAGFGGNWDSANLEYSLTAIEEGVYNGTFTNLPATYNDGEDEISFVNFKILPTDTWDISLGYGSFNLYNEPFTAEISTLGNNIYCENWTGGDLTVTVNWDAQTVTLEGSNQPESGVETLGNENGAVRYFNLHGVEVANPDKGIYIRVQDGKAVKVVR